MKQTKQKQVVPESKLQEVTGGGQIKDADVSRPTPVDAGDLVAAAPVEFCSVCNAPLIGTNKECRMCKINASQTSGIQSNSQNPPLVDVPPYRVRG